MIFNFFINKELGNYITQISSCLRLFILFKTISVFANDVTLCKVQSDMPLPIDSFVASGAFTHRLSEASIARYSKQIKSEST